MKVEFFKLKCSFTPLLILAVKRISRTLRGIDLRHSLTTDWKTDWKRRWARLIKKGANAVVIRVSDVGEFGHLNKPPFNSSWTLEKANTPLENALFIVWLIRSALPYCMTDIRLVSYATLPFQPLWFKYIDQVNKVIIFRWCDVSRPECMLRQ